LEIVSHKKGMVNNGAVVVLAAFDVFFFWRAGQHGDALLTIYSCAANRVRGCSIKQYLNGF
jgi:hypothetical protein